MNCSRFGFRHRHRIVYVAARLAFISVVFAPSLGLTSPAFAQGIEALSPLRAQSVVVLRIEVDGLPDDRAVYVEIKGPEDQDYRPLDLLKTGYFAIRGAQFTRTSHGRGVLVVPTFLTGAKAIETARHPFEVPGRYMFRLKSYEIRDRRVPPREVVLFETEMELIEPTTADQEYFALAGNARITALVGLADLDRTTGDGQRLAGLALMARIVESTRQEGDPTHGRSEWAEPLYDLAFGVPDCSYAPYLAYYAACSYMWQRKNAFVKKEYGYELPDQRVGELEHYQRARKALEFAVERGDSYIKPFATCFLAAMKAWAADLTGARTLIQSADVQAHESSQIAHMIQELNRFILAEEHKVEP
ncbi:MAG: hypothetical protein JSU86_05645 [Phycisphaerales bacterium]|nr:MAG: hypothetical protein JSU86_05645 [Phycisphaerales bacterium]